MQKIPMTKQGYEVLEQELKNLKEKERPNIIVAIAEAREHGDLSENAEYHAAREKQSFIEGRIAEVESIISLADVIDPISVAHETVRFGATVVITDCETDVEKKYQIVGDPEANLEQSKISLSSPLAKSLIGKEEGDIVSVRAPSGNREYEIIEIIYK